MKHVPNHLQKCCKRYLSHIEMSLCDELQKASLRGLDLKTSEQLTKLKANREMEPGHVAATVSNMIPQDPSAQFIEYNKHLFYALDKFRLVNRLLALTQDFPAFQKLFANERPILAKNIDTTTSEFDQAVREALPKRNDNTFFTDSHSTQPALVASQDKKSRPHP